MKKNTMMRLASFLLIAVLITTSAISGTYAKYVTQDSASDSARVAKWGVELQVVGNLFGKSYDDTIVAKDDTNLAVQVKDVATATENVVAPGTKNDDGFTFSLKGQPEVDGKVELDIETKNVFLGKGAWGVMIPVDTGVVTANNFDEMTGLFIGNNNTFTEATAYDSSAQYYTLEDEVTISEDYYPLIFKAKQGTTVKYAGATATNDDTLKVMIYALDDKFTAISPTRDTGTGIATYDYAALTFNSNDDLANVIDLDDLTITWEWPFERSMDGADTILGMLKHTTEGNVVKGTVDANGVITGYTSTLVEHTDYCVDVMFDITITVTQVN